MIIIRKPYKENIGNTTFLRCRITDTLSGEDSVYYYSTPIEYGDFLVDEVCDCFMYAAILPAVMSEQDITCEAPVSERLYYNAINSLIYITSLANDKLTEFNETRTHLIVKETFSKVFSSFAVGCGCSLGVDSLAAIAFHHGNKLTPDYDITHLTYFNVGAHGYKDLEKVKKSYEKDLIKVKDFATRVNLPLVQVESNICLLFKDMTFDQTGNYINISTVLSLQKLFKTYLYGSNDPIKEFRFDSKLAGYYESMYLPLSSTPSTQLVVANPYQVRSQKTQLIMNMKEVQNSLYVCWKELMVNNNPNDPIASIIDKKLNCTRCDKCLRTCLTLDIYGVIDKYSEIFDLPYYFLVKDKYIGRVLALKKSNSFYKDLSNLLRLTNYHISIKSKLYAFLYKSKIANILSKIKRMIK